MTRRRRSPDVARQEILAAAAELFRSRPPTEVTVRAIMNATTLARTSFYAYFDSRAELLLELVGPLLAVNRDVIERWPLPGAGADATGRDAIEALVRAWETHGALLHALEQAAHDDSDAAAAFGRFARDSVARIADKIRAEIDAGRVEGIDPDETALALVLMNRAYITHHLFGAGPTPDRDTLVDTLHAIWQRVLWGRVDSHSP
jgi:TetR/AcrR family transcriptional regulator, ethionamide resistance regulator